MKELVFAASIILIIATLSIISLSFTENVCNEFCEKLAECSDKIIIDDWDSAEKILKEAHEMYDRRMPLLKTFLNHRDLFEMQNLFIKIKTSISLKNTEMGLVEINTLISDFNTLSTSETLTLPNVI